jgi:hypothetical protein
VGELFFNIVIGIAELVSLAIGKLVLILSGKKSGDFQATMVGLAVCGIVSLLVYLLSRA